MAKEGGRERVTLKDPSANAAGDRWGWELSDPTTLTLLKVRDQEVFISDCLSAIDQISISLCFKMFC